MKINKEVRLVLQIVGTILLAFLAIINFRNTGVHIRWLLEDGMYGLIFDILHWYVIWIFVNLLGSVSAILLIVSIWSRKLNVCALIGFFAGALSYFLAMFNEAIYLVQNFDDNYSFGYMIMYALGLGAFVLVAINMLMKARGNNPMLFVALGVAGFFALVSVLVEISIEKFNLKSTIIRKEEPFRGYEIR